MENYENDGSMPEGGNDPGMRQPDMRKNPTENPSGSWWQTWGTAVLVGVAVLAVLVIGGFYVAGNADDPCTRQVSSSTSGGACSNGAWDGWETVGTDSSGNTQEKRVYTGTRVTYTVEYTTSSASCNNSGVSGTAVTETQACQIEESRTLASGDSTGGTGGTDGQGAPAGTIIGEVTTTNLGGVGDTTTQTVTINSQAELNAFRRSIVDADIRVVPSLVRPDDTVQVVWETVEMSVCSVRADNNNDVWEGNGGNPLLSGDEESSPIDDVTTYTLNCLDFEGNPQSASATVRIAPTWEEI
jgi:hypothetical protein